MWEAQLVKEHGFCTGLQRKALVKHELKHTKGKPKKYWIELHSDAPSAEVASRLYH